MTTHLNEELPALVAGELDGEATRAIAHHLRICGECRSELAEVAVAHGSLVAAMRAEQELGGQLRTSLPPPAESPRWPTSAEGPQASLRLPRRHQRAGRVLVAACLVLVAAATALAVGLSQHSSPRPIAAVGSLRPLVAPADAGGAVVVRAVGKTLEMSVRTKGLPQLPPDEFYEVWLLQPKTNKMLPVGVLAPSGNESYGLSAPVIADFTSVDVSLQANDGNPVHSLLTVLSGFVKTDAHCIVPACHLPKELGQNGRVGAPVVFSRRSRLRHSAV